MGDLSYSKIEIGQKAKLKRTVTQDDIEKFADVIKEALEMNGEEKRSRMIRMREAISENNIYHWAEKVISDLVKL